MLSHPPTDEQSYCQSEPPAIPPRQHGPHVACGRSCGAEEEARRQAPPHPEGHAALRRGVCPGAPCMACCSRHPQRHPRSLGSPSYVVSAPRPGNQQASNEARRQAASQSSRHAVSLLITPVPRRARRWVLTDAFVVLTEEGGDPMHQDVLTGIAAYTAGGFRLVFDLTGGRIMVFEVRGVPEASSLPVCLMPVPRPVCLRPAACLCA